MNDVVGILYHHLSASGSSPESHNATKIQPFVALNRLVAAGFTIGTDGERMKVTPSSLLTPTQRDWLVHHKAALLAAMASRHWRWCVEYPDGDRFVVDFLPGADWRRVSNEYSGAMVWPAPDGFDAAAWMAGSVCKPRTSTRI